MRERERERARHNIRKKYLFQPQSFLSSSTALTVEHAREWDIEEYFRRKNYLVKILKTERKKNKNYFLVLLRILFYC